MRCACSCCSSRPTSGARSHVSPSRILSFERVLKFLDHLEKGRNNRAQTRNQRLAAVHAFFDYVAGRLPDVLDVCQRVAAIPRKRAPRAQVTFLERDEMAALMKGLPSRGARAFAIERSSCSCTTRARACRRPFNFKLSISTLTACACDSTAREQVAHVPALERDRPGATRARRPADPAAACVHVGPGPTAHEVRHLQDRAPARPELRPARGRRATRPGHPARLSPHHRRPPAGIRGGAQCHPRMVGDAHISTTNHYAEINTKAKEEALPSLRPWRRRRLPPEARLAR